jgi:hypothetical protein
MKKVILLFFTVLFVSSLVSSAAYLNSEVNVATNSDLNINTNVNVNANTDVNTNADVRSSQNNMIEIKGYEKLNLSGNSDLTVGQNMRVTLSNGRFAYIRILPETASVRAQQNLNASCQNNNCSIELKEVGSEENKTIAYEVTVQKESRIFGLINKKMNIKADVDSQTGNVISVRRPWWSFVAVESKTQLNSSL